MTPLRFIVLAVAPAPIVVASMGLTAWFRSEPALPLAANDIVGDSQETVLVASNENVAQPMVQSHNVHVSNPRSLAAACDEVAKRLQQKLGADCHVISRAPFVIGGDMSSDDLDSWHRRTVQPATEAMASSYFKSTPTQPITVLLFTGEASYTVYAQKLFGEKGISIYGYYKPHERTLVMNISTGGGTLVHELTHALAAFDFPHMPDWFNEGLASLHEQCRFREGEGGPWIEGLENWRLPGLQKAIRQKRLRPLKTMIEANDFRGPLEGTNYAQARYFCLYLQRQGLLVNFYRNFHANREHDALGTQTLTELFADVDWPQLDRDFQAWAIALTP